MAELTIEQRKAIAMATARRRMAEAQREQPSQAGQVNSAAKQDPYMSPGEFAMDSVKSLGAGMGRGATYLAGLPGDISALTQRGMDWLMQPDPETQARMSQYGTSGPTSSQILGTVNDMTRPAPGTTQLVTGEQPKAPLEYEGKSGYGRYMGTVGEFSTGALGPGGPVRKAANILLPAAGSEGAGKLTEGTAAEPYARAAGALLGGVAAAGRSGNVTKQVAKGAPALDDVLAARNAAYDKLRSAGIKYDANAFDTMAVGLGKKLVSEGFDGALAPKADAAFKRVAQMVGKGVDYNDVETMRKIAGLAARSIDPTDRKFSGDIIEALDTFTTRSPFITSGNVAPSKVQPLMKEAREMARRAIIARDIDEMVEKAQTYQSGADSGLRNQFASYLRSKKGKRLTPQEREAFTRAAKGTITTNALRTFGRLGFDFSKMGNTALLGPLAGAGVGGFGLGPVAGLAIPALGTAAKYGGRKLTQNLATQARNVALAGRGAQRTGAQVNRAIKGDVGVRRAITGINALQAPFNQPPFYLPVPSQGRDR